MDKRTSTSSCSQEYWNFLQRVLRPYIHDHRIAWQETQILKTESDYSKWLFAESWFINKESNILNRNDGVAFPSTYTKLLNY